MIARHSHESGCSVSMSVSCLVIGLNPPLTSLTVLPAKPRPDHFGRSPFWGESQPTREREGGTSLGSPHGADVAMAYASRRVVLLTAPFTEVSELLVYPGAGGACICTCRALGPERSSRGISKGGDSMTLPFPQVGGQRQVAADQAPRS